MAYRNRAYINNDDSKYQEALDDLQSQIAVLAKQVKGNPDGPAKPPNAPAQLAVSAALGLFSVSVHDKESEKSYVMDYSTDPQFGSDVKTVDMGVAKTWQGQLGSQRLFFRVRATHYTGSDSEYVYHGNSQGPSGVEG